MIKVESLKKNYGSVLAVDGISFSIERGEVVGLLGPNGAGKSTTMKILTTYLPASEGKVSIAGFDVFSQSLDVRKVIGYLPENCPLYLDMEVQSFLEFIAQVRSISQVKKAVEKVVSDCGLGPVTHKLIGHLSKGYRQRVGLAQALIHDPQILILDEPTSGLDPNQIRDILSLINNLGKEKTVIHSTHILSEVEKTSNRVLIINNGKIVGEGSPKSLMAQTKGDTVFAAIKGNQISEKLKLASFISDFSELGDAGNGYIRYALHGQDNLVAENLFELAVANSWKLSELQTKSATLEDVFSKLTKGA